MKKQMAFVAGVLVLAGCTKQEVVTQTENGAETNVVLSPKRGAGTLHDSNNPNSEVTGILRLPGAPDGAAGAQSNQVQRTGNAADDELAQRVKVAISTGSTGTTGKLAENDLTPLQVEAKDGVVTLRGVVESQSELESVILQVIRMEGVKDLKTELSIGPVKESPARTTTVQGNANESLPSQQ